LSVLRQPQRNVAIRVVNQTSKHLNLCQRHPTRCASSILRLKGPPQYTLPAAQGPQRIATFSAP
jgi:hypothetical protein